MTVFRKNLKILYQNFQITCRQHLKRNVHIFKIKMILQDVDGEQHYVSQRCFSMFHYVSAYDISQLEQKWKWKEIYQSNENGQNEDSDEIKLKSSRKNLKLSKFKSICVFCKKDESEIKLLQCQSFPVEHDWY